MSSSQEYSLQLGLDLVPITTDPENLPDMYRLYNATKNLAVALDSAAGTISRPKGDWNTVGSGALRLQNLTRFYCLFSETVAAGHLINIYNNAGVPNARKAGGVSLAQGLALGFVQEPVTAGQYGEIFLGGVNPYIAGLTPGALYYTSTITAGLLSASAGSPYIQSIGFALDSSHLWFAPTLFAR